MFLELADACVASASGICGRNRSCGRRCSASGTGKCGECIRECHATSNGSDGSVGEWVRNGSTDWLLRIRVIRWHRAIKAAV